VDQTGLREVFHLVVVKFRKYARCQLALRWRVDFVGTARLVVRVWPVVRLNLHVGFEGPR